MISGWMTTFTGRKIYFSDLTMDDISIEDIAHHLACINRFNGALKFPVNVAQHSVYVARIAEDLEPGCGLQGLLHDASEAYIGDITKWLKMSPMFAHYRELEDYVQKLIYRKFNCQLEDTETVKAADKLMVRFEAERGHLHPDPIGHPDYPRITIEEKRQVGKWQPWSWQSAEAIFLAEFRRFGLGHGLPRFPGTVAEERMG